jgi:hypothetical protein
MPDAAPKTSEPVREIGCEPGLKIGADFLRDPSNNLEIAWLCAPIQL